MVGRFIDISTDGLHLSVERGFMRLSREGETVGKVPLDDIAAVLVHAHGASFSMNLVARLAERKASLVLCDQAHRPIAWLWPADGHYQQGKRMQAQADASVPKRKRIWRDLVKAKIQAQARSLEQVGQSGSALMDLVRKVKSGDSENIEAQAARRYWRIFFGEQFRRDTGHGVANSLLNYGYTVLRAATARALIGAGLHPSLSVHHQSGGDALCLADDVMEPFRPYVDLIARRLVDEGAEGVGAYEKSVLAQLTLLDLDGPRGVMPLMTGLERLCLSIARIYLGEEEKLELPGAPLDLSLASLGDDG